MKARRKCKMDNMSKRKQYFCQNLVGYDYIKLFATVAFEGNMHALCPAET